uniref:STARP antigen, putative n=1 Tax=Schistosoma mansoni TaxID=6183 RepID=A0A3Q0KM37_SCHMA
MIPYTESCGNYTRVPPIANIHSPYHIQQINSNGSSSTCASNENTICSRRGRRSNVPPEIREQTRRLKKQNMERRRRACISDKMNALHNLAMDLIGIDPNKCHKVEKADILNLCQSVFEGITNIAKDEPKFQERLRKLRYNLNEIPNSSSIASTTSSSSLSTSTNNSTSNLNENMNVNGKDNSLRKFTRNSHQHRSYHQSQQHSHSTNNISSSPTTGTTTTANTNTQMFSTSTISPPLPTIDQTIDEDDKENRIPRLLIKSNSSTGNYNTPYVNNVTVNSTCNVTPISSYVTHPSSSYSSSSSTSSKSSFSSSSVTSTPINNLHSRVNGLMMQWQSTPLQYNDKYNSLLSDCDSGFFSSGIQSVGFTPNANNVVGVGRTDISIDSVQCTDLCSVNVSNTDQRNCNVFMSCMGNMSSLAPSSLSCDGHLSAFSVPVARSGLAGMNKSIGLHPTSVGHGKVDNAFVVDSISCTQGLISSSTGVSSETISTKDPVMWRPYLD